MAYGRSPNGFASGAVRLLIGLGLVSIILTVMGMIDLGKDAFGSHKNFEEMEKSEFKVGDIVHGTITETIGCAATVTTTETMMYLVETDKYTSAVYYIIPYFDDLDDPYPNKILFYKTGNKQQMADLESLESETAYWYSGSTSGTTTHISVDRAEIVDMNSEEKDALYNYIDEFIDLFYEGQSQQTIDYMKISYKDAVVPYVIQYNAGGGNIILPIGLVMLGIFVIIMIVCITKSKRSATTSSYTYVGAPTSNPNFDPNLNSPTGLPNASSNPYFNKTGGAAAGGAAMSSTAAGGTRPTQTGLPPHLANSTTGQTSMPPYMSNARPTQPTGYRTDYSNSERPMPPITPAKSDPMKNREMNFDPYTGRPIEKKTLVDAAFGGQGMDRRYAQRPRPQQPLGDSMPSVDPKTEENVDLSNGGISWEDKVQRNATMPKNGDIPVINPESYSSAAMFGTIIPVEAETRTEPKPEPVPEKPVNEVTEIHPPTKEDNINSDFQVEQTDPEMRNIYKHMAGGQMNEVDPYTEKNVDVSNGGVELPDSGNNDDTDFRRSFDSFMKPEQPAAPKPVEQPVEPAFTMPTPVEPAPIEQKPLETKPIETNPDDYNIFKTGGNSYNIFKDDAPKADSSQNMGFPVENKEFPKVDTSFPDTGESDVGGKDDFIF